MEWDISNVLTFFIIIIKVEQYNDAVFPFLKMWYLYFLVILIIVNLKKLNL